MSFWNSLAFSMIQWILAIWFLVPLPFLNPAWTWKFLVQVLLKPSLENFEHYFISAGYSSVSSCLNCCVWGGLSVFWQFVVPLYCGGFSLWVGLDGWLVKISWLGKLLSVFWWVELGFFSLECSEMSSSEFWDVCGFGVTLGSLYIEAQGYVPVLLRIFMVCLALELVGP